MISTKILKKSGINLPDTLFFYLNPECCIRGFYSLIIVSNILNLSIAVNACGALAGNTILFPAFTVKTCPFTTIFADPSNTCTKASNGALCSLSPSPLSNENKVISFYVRIKRLRGKLFIRFFFIPLFRIHH